MSHTGETAIGLQGNSYVLKQAIGKGGEGEVYGTDQPSVVAKIYHKPTEVLERKIRCMIRKKIATRTADGTSLIAWPLDVLYLNGTFAGYTMPFIAAGKQLFTLYHDKSTREFFGTYNWTKSLCVAMNLAHLVDIIHGYDCVIGDMNPGNIMVQPNGLVSIMDVDSFDITDPDTGEHFKCEVGIPDYLAPELQHRKSLKDESSKFTKHTDEFALAVHIFLLLFHYHPFLARPMTTFRISTDVNQIDSNIVNGTCPFVRKIQDVALPVGAPALTLLPEDLQADFKNTFGYTALDSISKSPYRTSAKTWYEHLKALDNGVGTVIVPCERNREHYRRRDQPCELCRAKDQYDAWMAEKLKSSRSTPEKEAAATFVDTQTPVTPPPAQTPQSSPKSKGIYWLLLLLGLLAAVWGYEMSGGSAERSYQSAMKAMDVEDYRSAIDEFEELEDYKDSGDLLVLSKYGYITSHLDCEDMRTYKYLNELRGGSSECQEIYDSLYQWNVEFLCVNTDADDKSTDLSSIKSGTTVYWHFKITGGTPGAETDLYYMVYFEGRVAELKKSEDSFSNNRIGCVSSTPNLGSASSLYVVCSIYDGNKDILGSKDILITK